MKATKWIAIWPTAMIGLAVTACTARTDAYKIEETRLGPIVPKGVNTVFSPDGKRVAYAARKGAKWLVVVDGQQGAEYDEIGVGTLVFSPDGVLEYLAIKEGSLYRIRYEPSLQ